MYWTPKTGLQFLNKTEQNEIANYTVQLMDNFMATVEYDLI